MQMSSVAGYRVAAEQNHRLSPLFDGARAGPVSRRRQKFATLQCNGSFYQRNRTSGTFNEEAHDCRCGLCGRRRNGLLDGHGSAGVHLHRYRWGHRRLLPGWRRHLPTGEQGPQGSRYPVFGRIHRRLDLQHQHGALRRSGVRRRPVRLGISCLQRQFRFRVSGPVRESALGVLPAPGTADGARPGRQWHRGFRRSEGQAR